MNAAAKPSHHDHERKDVDVVSLFTIVLMLFISTAVVLFIVAIMMRYFNLKEPARTAGQANIPATRAEEFPQPRLEVKPGASLAELRAAEESVLNSYGWIDRNRGTV